MQLVTAEEKVTKEELIVMARGRFGSLVKAVVDVGQRIMVVDAELHSDQEEFLLERGSRQADLWGINLYPDLEGDDWLEFDSMINLRPVQQNMSRGVEDRGTQALIRDIVKELVR